VQRLATVSLTSARAGGKPRGNGSEQRGSADHEPQNDDSGARACNVFLGPSDYFGDAPLGIRGSQARHRGDKSEEIGTILGLHAAMARCGQKNAGCLGTRIADTGIDALRPPLTAK
jgi:hypothetical protein